MKKYLGLIFSVCWLLAGKSSANVPTSPTIGSENPAVVMTDDNGQRYLCMALLNIIEGDDWGVDIIKEGAKKGANAVMITVRWDVVEKTPTSEPYWTQFDNQMRAGIKVFLRIHLHRVWLRRGFWDDAASPRDHNGRTNIDMFSMAHQPTVDKALAFAKRVADRYRYIQNEGRMLCVGVTTTPTQEAGYHFNNVDENGNYYDTGYDYSDSMKEQFRQWLKGRYGEVKKLNEAWQSDYSDFDGIQPPRLFYVDSKGRPFADWYVFRHVILKKFLDAAARTIRSSDPAYKVINDFGSVFDGMSQSRTTFAFKNLAENADGTKINDAHDYAHLFSGDLLRSNTPANKWIMNEVFKENFSTHSGIIGEIEEHFRSGCKLVNFVVGKDDIGWYTPVIENIASNWLNKPMQPIETKQSMTIKLSDLVKRGSGLSVEEWHRKKQEGPVYIKLVEDLLGDIDASTNQAPFVVKPFADFATVASFPMERKLDNDLFKDLDDTTPLAYEMSGLPAGLSFDGQNIKGTPTATGTFKITLKATDDAGASAESQFTITITETQKIKVIMYAMTAQRQLASYVRPVRDRDIYHVKQIEFLANFLVEPDANIKAVKFEINGPIQHTQTEIEAPFLLFGDNGGHVLPAGKYTITAEVYNSTEMAAEHRLGREVITFTVDDKKNNEPPQVVNPIPNQKVRINGYFNYTIPGNTFKDNDGTIASVKVSGLPDGMLSSPDGWKIDGTPTKLGTYTIKVLATDNENANALTEFTLQVTPPLQTPVVLIGLPDQAAVVNQPFNYAVPFSIFRDPDGFVARVTVRGLPNGLSYQNGVITGRPAALGSYLVVVRAIDNDGLWVETTFRLTTKITNSNLAPVAVATLANQQAVVAQPFSYTLPQPLFRDPEGQTMTLTAAGLPAGLSLTNGVIAGTPTLGGVFTVSLRATDTFGGIAEVSFNINIGLANGNFPPSVIKNIGDQEAAVGVPYSFEIPIANFRDSDGFIVSIYVRGLPAGLTYQSGVISGTPTKAGNFTITVGVFDNRGAAAEDYFTLKVNGTPPAMFDYSLMRAGDDATRRLIQALKNEDKIVMTGLPAFLNIFAQPKVAADRVTFELDGPLNVTNTDGGSPFGLFDDYGGFSALAGSYVLKTTAFKDSKLVAEQTIRFEFVRNMRQGVLEEEVLPEAEDWVAFPNPMDETVMVNIPNAYEPARTNFSITDLQGKKWDINWVLWNDHRVELNLSPFGLEKGVYILQITNPDFPLKALKIFKK
jgi:Beta-galactosidase/Putative Ig domain